MERKTDPEKIAQPLKPKEKTVPAFRKHNGVTAIVNETKGTRDDIAHALHITDDNLPLHRARPWLCRSGTGNSRSRRLSWHSHAGGE
jgi:hypothetical protein